MTADGRKEGARKRRGCLFWTCGTAMCLAALFFTAVLAAYFLVPEPAADSAWDRAPKGAVWQVEVSGPKTVGRFLFSDGRIPELMGAYLASPDISAKAKAAFGEMLEFLESKYILAFRYGGGHLIPPAAVFGEAANGEWYAVVKFPWVVALTLRPGWNPSPGEVTENKGVHSAVFGDWVVVSPSREVCADIAGSWDRPAAGFGKRPEPAKPGVNAALALSPGVAAVPATEGDVFLFGGGAKRAAEEEPLPRFVAASLTASEEGGWRLSGGIAEGLGDIGAVSGWEPPPPGVDGSAGLTGRGRFSPVRASALLASLWPGGNGPDPGVDHPVLSLGWMWLRDGWLRNVSGDFVLAVSKPPTPERVDGVTGFPVTALGWKAENPDRAEADFNSSLRLWLDALSAPGGPLPVQSFRSLLKARDLVPPGRGGYVNLPPVAMNQIKPSWLFSGGGGEAPLTGWMATRPSGLPGGREAAEAFVGFDRFPDGEGLSLDCRWTFDGAFLDALDRLVRERAALLAWAAKRPEEDVLFDWALAREFFRIFTDGGATAHWSGDGGVRFECAIPPQRSAPSNGL